MRELLNKLCTVRCVSGYEDGIASLIKDEISPYTDECNCDKIGNVIAKKCGKNNEKKIVFSAHIDSHGYVVTNILKNGNLKFSALGESNPISLAFSHVQFETDEVYGIAVPDDKSAKDFSFAEMHIETGMNSREEAEKVYSLGDTFTAIPYIDFLGKNVTSNMLDALLPTAILIKALSETDTPEYDTYFVFTAESLLGARGAKAAVLPIDPDVIISVATSDSEKKENANLPSVANGNGPSVLIKEKAVICDERIISLIRKTAEKTEIKLQDEFSNISPSDLAFMQVCASGAAVGGIRIPVSYKGTAVETASYSDAQNTLSLIKELLKTKNI